MLFKLGLSAIEKLLNRYLALDPEIFAHLQKLRAKALSIEISELKLHIHLLICDRGIQCCESLPRPAEASIRGTPLNLFKLLLSPEPQQLIRTGEVIVTGNLDFVQQLQAILSQLKIDWVEQLAQYLGDTLATQIAAYVKDMRAWQQETSKIRYQNLGEYLQEEVQYLPPRPMITDFNHEVIDLSLAVDRLAARIARLENLLKEHR